MTFPSALVQMLATLSVDAMDHRVMVPDVNVLGIAVVDRVFGEELGTSIVNEQWGRGGGVLFKVLHQAVQPCGLFSSFSGCYVLPFC